MGKKTNMVRQYKSCKYCRGTGKIKINLKKLQTPDIKKMLSIMKKNKWTQQQLAKVLGISQGAISDWFYPQSNISGNIKKLYFDILKMKGFA